MKKYTISIVCVIVAFAAGVKCGNNASGNEQNGPDFYKLYDLYSHKSDLADTIMWRNNVFDADGGDQVAEYLNVSAKIDSIIKVNE